MCEGGGAPCLFPQGAGAGFGLGGERVCLCRRDPAERRNRNKYLNPAGKRLPPPGPGQRKEASAYGR
ncbi:hypothetical protein NDU88_000769 [Pleurodeles waltl]|uniref:Uncharacterized protein n=1 Tax=Pleurodeles waltl TaxID=8319 RepID=A0AAV7LVQ0_PLEWA|nr:hypothetical protein NDU88_000769 [Pleurodeles waltl]